MFSSLDKTKSTTTLTILAALCFLSSSSGEHALCDERLADAGFCNIAYQYIEDSAKSQLTDILSNL
jgi:hypothetical protein